MDIKNIKFKTYNDLEIYIKRINSNYTLAESVFFDSINWKSKESTPYTHLIYNKTHIGFLIELGRLNDGYRVIKIVKA